MATSRGDCGVWRENTGATAYTSTSWEDYAFDTEVLADGDFAQSGGSSETDFVMPEGHVLVIHNHGYETDGATGWVRCCSYIGLELDGSDIIYGRSSTYILDAASHKKGTATGAAIINVASTGDILTSRTIRIDSSPTPAAYTDRINASGLQCIKLDDNRGYFRATRSTAKDTAGIVHGNPALIADINAGTWEEVDWDAPDEDGRGFSLTGGAGTDEIIVPPARILVCFGVEFHHKSGTVRRNGVTRLQKRDGSGGSWVTIPNTHSTAYPRRQNSIEYGYATHISLVDVAGMTDPRLRVQFIEEQEDVSEAVDCEYTEAYITLGEMPDAGNYMYVNIDAAETSFTTTVASTTFEATPTEMDAGSFAYPAATAIQLKNDNKYLILGQFCAERSNNDGTRKEPEIRWFVGATATKYGYFAKYNRGWSGSQSTWISGGAGGFVHDASVDDLIQMKHTSIAATTDYLQAPVGYMSVQAIDLDSTFKTHSSDTVTDNVSVTKAALVGSIVGLLTSACSPTDSTRGGLVVEDTVYTEDRSVVGSYHAHEIIYPDNVVYRFPSGQTITTMSPVRDLNASAFDFVGASTAWQCIAQDPESSSDLSYVFPIARFPVFLDVGMSSVPNTATNINKIVIRSRFYIDNPTVEITIAVTINHPIEGEFATTIHTYPIGDSPGDIFVEDTFDGFTVDATIFNDRVYYLEYFIYPGTPDTVRIVAADMLVYSDGTEKDIDIENFDGKPAPSTDFSGGKSSSDPGWTEDDGPGPVFDPS